jgi:AraC-like DNA-binding protein
MADALSDILCSVRVAGGVFVEARLTAPWCVTACVNTKMCEPYLSKGAAVIAYHYVAEGRLLVGLGDGHPAEEVRAGEIIMFPHSDGHILGSTLGIPPVPTSDLVRIDEDGIFSHIDHGGGGEETRIICGFLGLEDAFNPLLATLPRILRLDTRNGSSRNWIEASVHFAAEQLAHGQGATSAIMARLSELLFAEAVRQHFERLDAEGGMWMAGFKDPQIAKALALIHRDICEVWPAEALAREVALSRSAFVERFTTAVGTPPSRYAAQLRLSAAKKLLREGRETIAQVAYRVGYDSEEAFSRAFKREFGRPPAQWRNEDAAA